VSAGETLPLPLSSPGAGAVHVRESARSRRLALRVYPGGRVEVRVPRGTRPDAIQRFVASHRAWIDARTRELGAQRAAEAPLPATVALAALGAEWSVRYLPRARAGLRDAGGGVLEVLGDPADVAGARARLRAWLRDAARTALEPWIVALARERGFRVGRVQVRRQQTRWGSCSRTGTVSLNLCLLFQRAEVVRYLMLHELCHTVHMNHSARFWSLVERHEPAWRALDRELAKGWQRVPDWVYA
jgi:hypothetical protein